MIAFKAKSLDLSVAPARLAGTRSRIPTAATMTWRMPLPARRRSHMPALLSLERLSSGSPFFSISSQKKTRIP
jgi:hypothetical protein